MFVISFWDVIASTAIALTTIPMPSDVYEVYPFLQGKAYGNVGTCVAQSFFIQLGTYYAFATTCCLNIYYLCTIRYGMPEDRMKKVALPRMLLLCALFALPPSVQSLVNNHIINPNPFQSFCTRCSYPMFCNVGDGGGEDDKSSGKCIRGHYSHGGVFRTYVVTAAVGASFFIMISSQVLVVVTALETEFDLRRRSRRMRRRGRQRSRSNLITDDDGESEVTKVSCMYTAASVLTWVWFLATFIKTRSNDYFVPGRNFLIARSIFRPLQGFLYAIIFIYQKAQSLRRANDRLGLMEAIFQVIKSPTIVPGMLISGTEVAEDHSIGDGVTRIPSNNMIRRGRGLGGSANTIIESTEANATHDSGDNDSNDSNDSNIDVASVAAQSDMEETSSPDALDEDLFTSLSSSPSVVDSEDVSSTGYRCTGANRLETVEEEGEESEDGESGSLDDEGQVVVTAECELY